MPDNVDFRNEIIKLEEELENTKRQNNRAAEFGLSIIAEKEEYQKRLKEYEQLYEQSQKELHTLQQAFKKLQLQKLNTVGNCFIEENDGADSNFHIGNEKIKSNFDAANEKELRRIINERDRLEKENGEIIKLIDALTGDRKDIEAERERSFDKIRELEKRENKLLQDLSELEDENLNLQKQVVSFRMNQMETDTLKSEIQNLKEQKFLQAQKLEDIESYKNILEKQIKETNQVLEREKMAHFTLKKEYERTKLKRVPNLCRKKQKSVEQYTKNLHTKNDYENGSLGISQELDDYLDLSANTNMLNNLLNHSSLGLNDLNGSNEKTYTDDKEIHDDAMPTYFSKGDTSPNSLAYCLEDIKHLGLKGGNNSNHDVLQMYESGESGDDNGCSDLFSEMESAKNDKLKNEINDLKREHENLTNTISNLKDQIQQRNNLNEKAYVDLETRYLDQQKQLAEINRVLNELNSRLLNKWITQLRTFCLNNAGDSQNVCFKTDISGDGGEYNENFLSDLNPLHSQKNLDRGTCSSPQIISNVLNEFQQDIFTVNTLWDKYIVPYLENISKNVNDTDRNIDPVLVNSFSDQNGANTHLNLQPQTIPTGDNDEFNKDNKEDLLLKEIQKLKFIITNKRNKNAHYRQVLSSYKSTAEACFSKMQTKYDEERKVVMETLNRYRKELGVYKEDCLTLGSQLSNLRQELIESHKKTDSLEQKCEFLESERKTLNGMLKTAIQQKFALIQKVESLECFNFFGGTNDLTGENDSLIRRSEQNMQNESQHDNGHDRTSLKIKSLESKLGNISHLNHSNTNAKTTNINSLRERIANLTPKHYYFDNTATTSSQASLNKSNGINVKVPSSTIFTEKPKHRRQQFREVKDGDRSSAEVVIKQPKSTNHNPNKLISSKEKQQLLAHMFLKPHLSQLN